MTGLRERFGRPLRLGIIGGGPDVVDRPHASRRRRNGRMVAARSPVSFPATPARSRAAGAAHGIRSRRAATAMSLKCSRAGTAACGRHRRGRDHDAERHALPVRRRRARRRSRCRRRQAGDARFQGGLRSGRARTPQWPNLRHRARLFGVSDDALRPPAGARRRARSGPPGAGRVHPERHGDARRGRAAEQSHSLDPRSAAQRTRAGDERDRLSCAASGMLRLRTRRWRVSRPTSARCCRAARSSITCRR